MSQTPVDTKWVDTNKGDDVDPLYRSRIVAMEFRRSKAETVFAGTPPLEAFRIILAVAAKENPAKVRNPYRIKVIDIKRAHFYAKALRKVLIKLPPEDPRSKEADLYGLLLKTMYGTLDAAARWEAHYSTILVEGGCQKGKGAPPLALTITASGTSS